MGASPSNLPPGPRRYPIVKNLAQLTGDGMFYSKLSELQSVYGDVVYLELGAVRMMVVFGHDKVRKVLKEQEDTFKYRPDWLVEIQTLQLSHGIVWSNGLQNEKLRKFALPVVHPGLGKISLAQRVQTEAKNVVAELQKQTSGDSDTLKRVFYKAICNINCGFIFGERYEYADEEFLHFIDLMDQMLQKQGIKNPLNFFPILQKLPESKKTKETKQVLNTIKEFIHGKVESARKSFDKDNLRSLVDVFLQQESSENPVTEENLCHIVRDFFVAGTENVAISILWCVGYVTQFASIQEKCRKCIETMEETELDMENIAKMPYIEATVNEALRLANVAPLSVPHAVVQETKFEDYTIPKDTMVLTHLVSVHNDPKYWDTANEFNPDRFLGSDGKLVQKEAFYPFSIGPRYCLAARLAHMEILLIFGTLIKNFKFESVFGHSDLQKTQPGAFVEPKTFKVTWSPRDKMI